MFYGDHAPPALSWRLSRRANQGEHQHLEVIDGDMTAAHRRWFSNGGVASHGTAAAWDMAAAIRAFQNPAIGVE